MLELTKEATTIFASTSVLAAALQRCDQKSIFGPAILPEVYDPIVLNTFVEHVLYTHSRPHTI